jgi:hypothetical protein
MPLPGGRDWELYPDANVVALAPHLDECGRERALEEACVFWRRSLLHVVPYDPVPAQVVNYQ